MLPVQSHCLLSSSDKGHDALSDKIIYKYGSHIYDIGTGKGSDYVLSVGTYENRKVEAQSHGCQLHDHAYKLDYDLIEALKQGHDGLCLFPCHDDCYAGKYGKYHQSHQA